MGLFVPLCHRYNSAFDIESSISRAVGIRGKAHGYILKAQLNLLSDGDMEASDVSAWSAIYADLSKESGAIQGSRCLRVTLNDINHSPAAQQAVLTIGKRYRVFGFVRSPSGHLNPKVYLPPDLIVVADYTSSDWQFFAVEMDSTASATVFRLYGTKATGAAVGDYVEWDNVWLEEIV